MFDDDFKAQAVRLVLEDGKSVGAVGRDLDLSESALRHSVERTRADETGGRTDLTIGEREELAWLRKENRGLRTGRDILKKGRGPLREAPGVRIAWIAAERAEYSMAEFCPARRVSSSGFYPWPQRPESLHAARDRHLRV